MRRPISMLVVILALQLGLAALLAVRKSPLASITPQTPLIGVALDRVDHIVIEGQPAQGASPDSARVELARQKEGQWTLTNYYDAPADKFRLSSVLDELASLKRGLPIGTSAEALKRFRVLDDNFERRVTLRAGGKVLSTVYFGSSSGARQTDARSADDRAVYGVQLATYELPASPSEWLDQDILQRDPDGITEIDIQAGSTAMQLTRRNSAPAAVPPGTPASAPTAASTGAPPGAGKLPPASSAAKLWVATGLPKGQSIDAARAEALAHEVAELHVQAILGANPLPDWQTDHPALTLRIRDSKHPEAATWTLCRPTPAQPPAAEYYVLKDSTQPWYFKVSAAAGKQLLDDSSPQQLAALARPAVRSTVGKPEVGPAHTHRAGRARKAAGTAAGA